MAKAERATSDAKEESLEAAPRRKRARLEAAVPRRGVCAALRWEFDEEPALREKAEQVRVANAFTKWAQEQQCRD